MAKTKKPRTPAQLANDERLRNQAKQRKASADGGSPAPEPKPTPGVVTDKPDSNMEAMQKQIDEVMETNALLKAALLKGNNSEQQVNIGKQGFVGEVDKYLVDPENYPDPTKRLANEPRLETIAFKHNYQLDYDFSIRPYENKGINYREPEFTVRLLRIKLDDQGNRIKKLNPTTGKEEDVMYIARRLMFHEDPQAALVIARDNNIEVDKTDEKTFLDEMRYLRVRDWLFDYFWHKGTDPAQQVQEETVGGTIVQFITKSSEEPSALDFDQLNTKV